MKRSITYLLATVILFTIAVSCKKDDPAAPSVVGTWKFSGSARTNCDDASNNGTESCTGNAAECGQLVLTSSNTYTFTPPTSSGDPAETGTYVISGTNLTNTPTSGGGSAQVGTFTVTATTLTLTSVDTGSGCTSTTTFTRL